MDVAERKRIDEIVVAQIERGDAAGAATTALRAYGPPIFGFLWMALRNEEDTEEAFAQFSEDLWRGIGSFRGECRFRTWAYQLAHNSACRLLRGPFRRRRPRLPSAAVQQIVAEIRESTKDFQRTTLRDGVGPLRAQLPP